MTFVLKKDFKDYVIMAHNLKGFDGQPVLKWLVENGHTPFAIFNGSKMIYIDTLIYGIKFSDSLNFIPIPLKDFKSTFGLKECEKFDYDISYSLQ